MDIEVKVEESLESLLLIPGRPTLEQLGFKPAPPWDGFPQSASGNDILIRKLLLAYKRGLKEPIKRAA